MPQRPDRVLFPETGFTKADASRYYKAIAKALLPHLKNRPLSFKRYVDTIRGESFWEKDAPSFTPSWVKRVAVPRRGEGEEDIDYIVVNDAKTLAWIVDVGGIELHPFLHVAPRVDLARAVVFDLDPGEGADIRDCARVALVLRDALPLQSFAKVSGSKGIQVYVPVAPTPHVATEAFARLVADELARRHPTRIVSKMAKPARAGKVFIDWSQNADFKTTVAVYSLRAKSDEPHVSMPVRWEELEKPKKLSFDPEEAIARVEKLGDLFAPVLKLKQRLPGVEHASGLLPSLPKAGRSPTRHESALPKAGSQSGRRLFLLVNGVSGNELWLDMRGRFKRWILRPDREGGDLLIAMPAGDFEIDPAYRRGQVPKEWQSRVKIEDAGSYELIEGSSQRRRFDLWFNGRILGGEWLLEKTSADSTHKSWRLAPRGSSPSA
jgi:bifunctional non-homologous end joining protein LigD